VARCHFVGPKVPAGKITVGRIIRLAEQNTFVDFGNKFRITDTFVKFTSLVECAIQMIYRLRVIRHSANPIINSGLIRFTFQHAAVKMRDEIGPKGQR
jgi:hypothetical protein